MDEGTPNGYDGFCVNMALAWLEWIIKKDLITQEEINRRVAMIKNNAEIIPFPATPRVKFKPRQPEEYEVFVISFTDLRVEVNSEQERKWTAIATRSTEALTLRYIEERQGKEYGILYGYQRFILDK